jgi:Tol biopolymer transport system component
MRLTDDPVGSMYWSPDGTKLALLTISRQQDGGSTASNGILASPLPQEVVFRWMIYHVETDELEPLVSFDPTVDFLQLIPFFDQYHLSLTFWSPDSRYLVISKENAGETTGTIWVVDTTGEEEPRQVAEGTLAIWSWQ